MPEHLKTTVWDRFVDDVFAIYRGSDDDFRDFFVLLNSFDPFIEFTCERSRTGVECGLGDEVVEALPFLDLVVTRHLDRISNTLSNKLAIYRKPCHSGSYIHFLSCQPIFTKKSVIRSIFLRAFRYCDAVFLDMEIRRIYEDFTRMGYPCGFIDKAKISAKRGRDHEIKVKAKKATPKPPRTKQPYTLVIPYHNKTRTLKSLYAERGIDVIYSNKDSIGSRVKRNEHPHTDSGVYVFRCSESTCDKVYVGESGNIPRRFEEHRGAQRGRLSSSHYATAKHKHPGSGLMLDIENAVVPYRSSNKLRMKIIEACLISLCTTVKDNKASCSIRDMDILGPIILGASPIDWKLLASAHPTLSLDVVPKAYKRFFTNPSLDNPIAPVELPQPPLAPPSPPGMTTRSRNAASSRNDASLT